jgi:vacuolar protein sorting-associated protein 45
MVSLVYSQTDIINREVFLVERIDVTASSSTTANPSPPGGSTAANAATKMHHLKAVCFVRPDAANIEYFRTILRKPKYKEFHICKCEAKG